MADKKIIAVLGATGAQGGGLARAILNDPDQTFALRAITRKPDADKAKALKDAGAEVVAADLDDVESLKKAFAGAYGVYGVTNFWEHFSGEKEKAQGQNIAEAAKTAGVKHAIWSTFEDVRKSIPLDDARMPNLQDKYKVPHFDAKAEADPFFRDAGVPTTFLLTSFYWDNLIHFGLGPKKGSDGILAITYPTGDKKLPGIWVEDIGKCALGIFKAGGKYIGKTVGVAGGHLTGEQMAASLTRALGQEVRFNAVSPDAYRGFGFPGADEMGNMFQFKADFEEMYCGNRSLEESRALNPSLQTFDQWLSANKDKIPLE
jgi:uncharacterized protein YbjT (DUF2867 family)